MNYLPTHDSARPATVDLEAAARAIDDFLRAMGQHTSENPELSGTGRRVAEAFAHQFCAGSGVDLRAALRIHAMPRAERNENSAADNARILLRGIRLATMCPHHLLPAEGRATIALAPRDVWVGLGGLDELVQLASRRLILQEQLVEDLTAVLHDVLAPRWVQVHVRLAHGCMRVRGELARDAEVDTWASRGDVPSTDASWFATVVA